MNVEIKNEAGRDVIATGVTDGLANTEFTVDKINNPDVLFVHSEYQVGQNGGQFYGVMCTAKNGTSATFKK